MRQLFLVLTVFCLIFFTIACFDGPYTDVLPNVPYRSQEHSNYCAVACIQMWAWYDGNYVTQTQIADYIGLEPLGADVTATLTGIEHFTNSFGFLVMYDDTNIGQDYCIASCIASVKDFTPSIMPFSGGIHGVLVIGFTWHYNEDDIRVADEMVYHDPDPSYGAYQKVTADALKIGRFWPILTNNRYMVFVGRRSLWKNGVSGYNTFIAEGGTFYGGPAVYNPLTYNPFEN